MVLYTKITLLYAISYKRNKLNSRSLHSLVPRLFFTVDSLKKKYSQLNFIKNLIDTFYEQHNFPEFVAHGQFDFLPG